MKTRDLAAVAIFSALAAVLNFLIRIPDPLATFLYYQIWEIPILVAFFLFGVTVLFMVTCVNTLILLAFFQGASVLGPLYWLIAWLSMMAGIGLIKMLLGRHALKNIVATATLYTLFGVVFRTVVMSLVNYSVLRFPPPVGFSLPEAAILVDIPLIAFFNATLALYTIPISYSLGQVMTRYLRISK
jgi:riboflavin transporter FmnP